MTTCTVFLKNLLSAFRFRRKFTILKYILFMEGEDEIYESIDEYLKSLKPLPSPYLQNGKLSAKAKSGKKIFSETGL